MLCNTLLQCVAWWIASWADDEQYKEEQPREGLSFAGGDELLGGVQLPFSLAMMLLDSSSSILDASILDASILDSRF